MLTDEWVKLRNKFVLTQYILRRSEKQFFQHLNKASPDYGGQVVI